MRPEQKGRGSERQQVAGAAGTAVFVSIMSVQAANRMLEGADLAVATTSGIHTAFIVGAVAATVAIVLTLFVRKPAPASVAAEPEEILAE